MNPKISNNLLSFIFAGVLFFVVAFPSVENTKSNVRVEPSLKVSSLTAGTANLAENTELSDRKRSEAVASGAVKQAPFSVNPKPSTNLSKPSTKTLGAFIGDMDSGEIYFQKNDSRNWTVASLTKLMTALIAEKYMDMNSIVVMSSASIATEGTSGEFSPGERYSIADLLSAMLLVSSNDAAIAIAEFYGSDEFVKKMNAEAIEIGMNQTRFVEPSGLSRLNQSSVEDLFKLTRYIFLNNPKIFHTSRLRNVTIKELVTGRERQLSSIIQFAGRAD